MQVACERGSHSRASSDAVAAAFDLRSTTTAALLMIDHTNPRSSSHIYHHLEFANFVLTVVSGSPIHLSYDFIPEFGLFAKHSDIVYR